MKQEGKKEQLINWILAGGFVAAMMLIIGSLFDYYYDLNDDGLMKDILAGVYTGTPEGHNIQMLWPVSALISVFYRVARPLPWYGLFLCGCHFGCFFLILKRSLKLASCGWEKLLAAVAETLVFTAFFLEHLVYTQYTVSCTLLAGTAAFLFYTTDIELDNRNFVKSNLPAVCLVILAYLIRSEMLLLVLPMICVAGAAKWGSEKKIFTPRHAKKYFSVIGMILVGLLLSQGVHMLAYSSPEWKSFTELFNNRTELYDFQVIPPYEGNEAFYESVGLAESEKILFDNYNFGIDEEIDHELMGQVAEYAGKLRKENTPVMQNLKEKAGAYLYRFLGGKTKSGSDYPWNYLVILGYVLAFLTGIPLRNQAEQQKGPWQQRMKNAASILWKLAFLFAVRTVLWMYILWGERSPSRITDSLYLMEFLILSAMILVHLGEIHSERNRRWLEAVTGGLCILLAVMVLPAKGSAVMDQQAVREEVNAPYGELYAYFKEHPDQFYFMDVYSSVAYSEKMFKNVDNTLANYDILGGWACKSPLQEKKLAAFGITDIEQALREEEHIYFVKNTAEDMQWLFRYYEGHGTPVKAALLATISDTFEIYQISPAS